MARTALSIEDFDPLGAFKNALVPNKPWDSIIDFACHPSFCGQRLYPRQKTLLKLIYLETESMTSYDVAVIDEWRKGFMQKDQPEGVQEDIWERVAYLKEKGYTHFPHVQAVMGRRASKGKIGGILGAERMSHFLSLDNWQEFYGVSPGKDGYLTVVATNSIQAKKFQFADILDTVRDCEYLKPYIQTAKDHHIVVATPADMRRYARMKQDGVPMQSSPGTIHAVAMSSNSASGRGATGFANFFDEFAHMISGSGSKISSEEVYEAYQPSLDQFGKDSLTYVPSSPFTQVGKFYSLYKEGSVLVPEYKEKIGQLIVSEKSAQDLGLSDDDIEEGLEQSMANPEMLVVQLPSWALYKDYERSHAMGGPKFRRPIQEYNDRMKILEKSNPQKFSVERRAQFASVIDAYLDPKKVDAMYEPFWDGRTLGPQSYGRMDRKYHIHVDPSRTNANFALTVAHTEEAPPDENGDRWPHVIIDYMKVWKPKDFPDHTIDYVQVQREIGQIVERFPSTVELTFDQWNSAGMIDALKRKFPRVRVRVENFSGQANMDRMERLKSALNLGWIHAYHDDFYDGEEGSLLELEMKFLQRKGNRVDKQEFGPVTTKDLFDTVSEVTNRLLSDALERWYRKLLGGPPVVGSTDVAGIRSGRVMEMSGIGPSTARERLSSGGGGPSFGGSSIDRLRGRRL